VVRFAGERDKLASMKATLLWLAGCMLLFGCEAEPTPFSQVADVKQVMTSILEPAAEVYWDAVGTIIDENGTHEFAPDTPEEWEAVRNAAFVLAESGNLLMMRGRARDRGEWMTSSRAMLDAGRLALSAAEARNKSAVFDAGAEVYYACAGCHAKYASEIVRPSDTRDD
jgi:hypothetical protein